MGSDCSKCAEMHAALLAAAREVERLTAEANQLEQERDRERVAAIRFQTERDEARAVAVRLEAMLSQRMPGQHDDTTWKNWTFVLKARAWRGGGETEARAALGVER